MKLPNLGLILLGAIVGIFSATLGSGGGSIIIPALILIFKYEIKEVIGVSLATIVLTTLSGAITHYSIDPYSINFTVLGLVLIGSLIGAKIGSSLTHKIRSWLLTYISAIILIFVGIKLFGFINISLNINTSSLAMIYFILLGLFTGTISAMLGIGAGVILAPSLYLLFGLPIHHAIPTTLAIIAPTTLAGAIFHKTFKNNNYKILIYLIPGTIIGAILGSFLNHYLSESVLKITLGIYVLISAIEMITTSEIKKKRGHLFLEP